MERKEKEIHELKEAKRQLQLRFDELQNSVRHKAEQQEAILSSKSEEIERKNSAHKTQLEEY